MKEWLRQNGKIDIWKTEAGKNKRHSRKQKTQGTSFNSCRDACACASWRQCSGVAYTRGDGMVGKPVPTVLLFTDRSEAKDFLLACESP